MSGRGEGGGGEGDEWYLRKGLFEFSCDKVDEERQLDVDNVLFSGAESLRVKDGQPDSLSVDFLFDVMPFEPTGFLRGLGQVFGEILLCGLFVGEVGDVSDSPGVAEGVPEEADERCLARAEEPDDEDVEGGGVSSATTHPGGHGRSGGLDGMTVVAVCATHHHRHLTRVGEGGHGGRDDGGGGGGGGGSVTAIGRIAVYAVSGPFRG